MAGEKKRSASLQVGACARRTRTMRRLLAMLAAAAAAAAAPARLNVLYIVSDDLRAELPAYGHENVHAPNLAKLAASSLVSRLPCVQVLLRCYR